MIFLTFKVDTDYLFLIKKSLSPSPVHFVIMTDSKKEGAGGAPADYLQRVLMEIFAVIQCYIRLQK